ncbi:MAG: hypothetical protein LBU36_03350 [Clostridiales bacterium]|jgi:stage III sporulation protein AG|nr:hypothetical protein [Clostridiales bacterium]
MGGKLTEKFRDLLKSPRTAFNIAVGVILGVVLLAAGKFGEGRAPGSAAPETPKSRAAEESAGEYEKNLESRLSEILSQAEGAGKVRVMLTLSQGREIIVGEDASAESAVTKETDDSGGSRQNEQRKSETKKIILSGGGESAPLVLKEIFPRIEGVVIVARGGADPAVKDALTRACAALLGIETHKIQVLKMRGDL